MQLLQEDRQGIELLIEKLIPLKAVSIAGQLAMREVDQKHVEFLVLSDPRDWEPIKVTRTDKGYCYYDGQHRIQASLQQGQTSIVADCRTFTSEADLIDATFQSNLHHGLQATIEFRGDYAYWLYITYGDRLSQEQIAVRTGIRQGSVSKAIAKREKRLREVMNGEEEEQEDRLKSAKRLLTASKKFYEVASGEDYKQLVQEMHDLAKNVKDRDALYFLGQLLSDAMKPPTLVKMSSLTVARAQ